MKLRLIMLILLLGSITQAVAQAQPDTLIVKAEVEETLRPYKVAVGLRRSVIVGEYDFGVTAKYFISGGSAVEGGLSKVILQNNAYQLSLMYERHQKLFKSNNFLLYYGAGVGLLILNKHSDGLIGITEEDGRLRLKGGIGYIAGIEKGFGNFPLAVSLDFKGIYYLHNNTSIYRALNVVSPAISLKYRFGLQK